MFSSLPKVWKRTRSETRKVEYRLAASRCFSSAASSKDKVPSGVQQTDNLGEFQFELGGSIPNLTICWEEWGDKKNPNVVMVVPALSMGTHVNSTTANPDPGWWEGMIGEGMAIDTSKYRVISGSILGAPFGTNCATSLDPTGKRWGPRFPAFTTKDQAHCHKKLLDFLGIPKLHCAVGSSLGGMQVLSFAVSFPESLDSMITLCTTPRTSPGTCALRRIQRSAILADPQFKNGNYEPHEPPSTGLSVARELGIIVYRSMEEFNERFPWEPIQGAGYKPGELTFEIENYLSAQAAKFSKSYDANCYLGLSKCMDLHDVGRGYNNYQEAINRLPSKSLLIAFEKDMLIPWTEMSDLAQLLQAQGKSCNFYKHPSIYGHDAFLKELSYLSPLIRDFLG